MVKFINFESTCLNSQQYINLNVTDSNSLIYTFHDSKDDTQNLNIIFMTIQLIVKMTLKNVHIIFMIIQLIVKMTLKNVHIIFMI